MRRVARALGKLLEKNADIARRDIPAGQIRDQFIPGTAGPLPPGGNTGSGYTPDPDAITRVSVRKNSTGSVFSRRRLNLIEGSNVTLTVVDDSGNEEIDITIASSGGGGGGAPTTSEYLTTASDGTLSAEVVIPGLAGSADLKGAGGAGTAREFDASGDTLPTWSPSGMTTENSDTTIKSHYYAKSPGDTTARLGTYSWSPAGALDLRAKVSIGVDGTSGGTIGLHIGNSGDTSRVMLSLNAQATTTSPSIIAYTYESGTYTQRGSTQSNRDSVEYLRVTRDGSNNWSFYWSSDGLLWHFIATQALTFTIANMGLYVQSGGSYAVYGAIDWMRSDV